jgi:DNA-binding MarR family transcriptional regulator
VSSDEGPGPELSRRLGYLLKHAQLRMAELTTEALAPYGINGRELAVLLVLAGRDPQSQQQAARRLGIDRTTMVALLDALEDKGLVARHQHRDDRRRNVVELTETGQTTLHQATKASDQAEAQLLAPLSPKSADALRTALQTIVGAREQEKPE